MFNHKLLPNDTCFTGPNPMGIQSV